MSPWSFSTCPEVVPWAPKVSDLEVLRELVELVSAAAVIIGIIGVSDKVVNKATHLLRAHLWCKARAACVQLVIAVTNVI